MRFSETVGRQVVSATTAATVGKIDELVIDPRVRSVVGMTLKKTDHGDTLRWSDVDAFGVDAVIVSGAEKLTETPPDLVGLCGKDHRALGKRLLDTNGDELGRVDDVEFDPRSGDVTALVLADGRVPGTRLVGIGSYAVVVQHD
ncbi:hypothetical protein GCM10023147_10520 [Tsukamurella soli]|uniref:PRC-barrel domain-containing protein n=1 Tax=Tsukamurella soli TaxID=644556 RepID=A0ABP8J8B9_9ACTN